MSRPPTGPPAGEELTLVADRKLDQHLARSHDRCDALAQHAEIVVRDADERQTVRRFESEHGGRHGERAERTDQLREIVRAHALAHPLEDTLPRAIDVRCQRVTHTVVHRCS